MKREIQAMKIINGLKEEPSGVLEKLRGSQWIGGKNWEKGSGSHRRPDHDWIVNGDKSSGNLQGFGFYYKWKVISDFGQKIDNTWLIPRWDHCGFSVKNRQSWRWFGYHSRVYKFLKLRYNWHVNLYKIKVYNILVWYIYILRYDYHHSVS